MKQIQPTLINFAAFQVLNLLNGEIVISRSGIIHTNRRQCPVCGALCNYNGSSNRGHHTLSNSGGGFFRKGQQHCPVCDKTIQVENSWLDEIKDTLDHFVISQILSLSESLSEDEIVNHLENTMSIIISKGSVHNIIEASNQAFEDVQFDYELKEDYYGYDEQFIKISGRRAYRIVIFDISGNKVIYEKVHYRFSKKILKKVLREVFGDKKPKGFVVDMRIGYPDAFRAVFGKKIRLQFCVFHLNKLILKEYREALKVGKNVHWTLMDSYNLYCLFNIFYDRTDELKILRRFMKHHERFKHLLTPEKVEYYATKYKVKTRTFEKKKAKVIRILEMKLLKAFRKILHDKKNQRRREGKTLKARSIESARKQFETVYSLRAIYPTVIQKRIERIGEKFEYFIASGGTILTNNRLEGFFGATLKKFRKKARRSLLSLSALLKRKRAKQEGMSFFRRLTLEDLARIFTAVTLFT